MTCTVIEIKDTHDNAAGWYAAFKDRWYGDYVIELSHRRDTKEQILEDIANGTVHANMSENDDGK